MKIKKQIVFFLVLLTISGFAFVPNVVGVSQKPKSAVISISFWYTENIAEEPGVIQLITDFEAEHPDIEVNALYVDFFDARNLFTSSYIANTEPDVMRATRDWIPEFAASGMLNPLTDTFSQEDLDDFINISIEMVTYPDSEGNDQIWAYPQLVDTPAIMYNKEIFELAGIDTSTLSINTSWTWDEYLDILNQVNGTEYEYGGETHHVYATTLAGMMFGAQPYYFGHGAQMFYNDEIYIDSVAIDSLESRLALQFLKNLTDSSVTPNWLDQGWGPLNPSFRSGKVAMINQGPWELKQNIEIEPIFQGGDNLGIVQLPHDEEGHRGAPVGCHGYVISKHVVPNSAEYNASVLFAKYMSGQEAQKIGAIDYYHVPSRKSVMEMSEVKEAFSYPYVKAYWDAVQSALRVPVSKDWAQIETDFGDRINEYLAGEISLDECIANTLVRWGEYLPKKSGDLTDDVIQGTSSIPSYPISLFIGAIAITTFLLLRKRRI
ncbi:MAG: extracellular solute-binding protein [Candidatus Lokiarchaeota archaeon]|nr:extracellular solute-binding protein [Candidatus Harpocratesius repetitus]